MRTATAGRGRGRGLCSSSGHRETATCAPRNGDDPPHGVLSLGLEAGQLPRHDELLGEQQHRGCGRAAGRRGDAADRLLDPLGDRAADLHGSPGQGEVVLGRAAGELDRAPDLGRELGDVVVERGRAGQVGDGDGGVGGVRRPDERAPSRRRRDRSRRRGPAAGRRAAGRGRAGRRRGARARRRPRRGPALSTATIVRQATATTWPSRSSWRPRRRSAASSSPYLAVQVSVTDG